MDHHKPQLRIHMDPLVPQLCPQAVLTVDLQPKLLKLPTLMPPHLVETWTPMDLPQLLLLPQLPSLVMVLLVHLSLPTDSRIRTVKSLGV